VVEDVVILVRLNGEEFVPYKQDIQQVFLVSWMLDNILDASAGPLHPLMRANSLFTKLMEIMTMVFLYHRLYVSLIPSLEVEGGGNLKIPRSP
jgi:hypothetical protein